MTPKPAEPMTRTTIRVPAPLWSRTRIAAIKQGISTQALVIEALKQYLKGGD